MFKLVFALFFLPNFVLCSAPQACPNLHLKQKEEKELRVPYVYNNGENEINLFISIECKFCNQALMQLIKYLKNNPKVRVKIYFFTSCQEDELKICYLIAAKHDLDLLYKMHTLFLSAKTNKLEKNKQFQAFLSEHVHIHKDVKESMEKYEEYRKAMQKKFFKAHVDKTPVWIINETIMIEGAVEELEELVKVASNLK